MAAPENTNRHWTTKIDDIFGSAARCAEMAMPFRKQLT